MKLVSMLILSFFILAGCQKDSGSGSSGSPEAGGEAADHRHEPAELVPLENGDLRAWVLK
jgi:hypothetical protein